MGRGVLRISPELLLHRLLLLEGYGLRGARHDPVSDELVLVVEHPGIPNEEGQPIPDVVPIYSRRDGEYVLERVDVLRPIELPGGVPCAFPIR